MGQPNWGTKQAAGSLGLERIVFFSDAVMAIAMTLLAADLKVPQIDPATGGQLLSALAGIQTQMVSFVISFVVIGIYWLSHHRTFRYITRYDGRLALLNLVFLFFIVLMPFVARLYGEYAYLPLSTMIYSLALGGIALAQALVWLYATHRRRLVDSGLDARVISAGNLRGFVGSLLFFIAAPMAFVSIPLSFLLWWLSPILVIVSVRLYERRHPLT
jgi:uncharacterized membrane protein